MNPDFLIVGQGIAGTLLSHRLLQAGCSVLVLDDGRPDKASRVAGAVINPLSGKRWKPAAGADLFLPIAQATYLELEALLKVPLLLSKPLYIFNPAGQELLQHLDQINPGLLDPYFHIDGPLSCIPDTWLVEASALLDAWKIYLSVTGAFREESFDPRDCTIFPDQVTYRDITAQRIIFCDGAAAAGYPLWAPLPFTRNRGEALLLEIPGLPADALYHQGLRLAPRSDGLFWCGSNYTWDYDDLEPDAEWRGQTLDTLKHWLKLPFCCKDHIVAERPTTAGQVPLVGIHPQYPAVGILNGLGTRGFSAGPYWAEQLARQLLDPNYRIPRDGRADLSRWLG